MKKSLALFLALLCLAAGGLIGMGVWVSQEDERVEVTQTTLRGDPAAAEGLTVTVRNQILNQDQMFWDTSFQAQDASQSQTHFQFFYQRQYYYNGIVLPPGLILPNVSSGGFSSDGGLDLEQEVRWNSGMLMEPVIDLAKTMEPNQTEVLDARLADYYDDYPISVDDFTSYYVDENWIDQVERRMETLRRFFRIPMPPELQMTYTLTTNGQGDVIELDTETQQQIQVNSKGVPGENGYYYILDSYASPQEVEQGAVLLDLSHIRDGYGVYFIPAYIDPELESEQLEVEKIQTVYKVPEGERTVDLYADEKGNLLLYTVAGETWYLNVLSGDGRQLRERLELGRLGRDSFIMKSLEEEDFILLLFPERQFYLLTWDGNQYVLKNVLEMPADEKWDYVGKTRVAHWDGQRLALLEQGDDWPERVGYRLTVWQDGDLTYQGEYSLSFSKDNSARSQMWHADKEPIKVSG